MIRPNPTLLAVALAVTSFASCRSIEIEEPSNPVFDFLAQRYDGDQDHRITRDEYDRDGGDFERLDRDGDGVLTASDFEAKGRRQRGFEARQAKVRRAVLLTAWYLQSDDDRFEVREAELRETFDALDQAGDGRVGRSDFEPMAAARSEFGFEPGGRLEGLIELETTDPWERLLHGIDRDDDGFVTEAELIGFYREQPEGTWAFESSDASPSLRYLVGETAPDFTLPTIDGKSEVTLSDSWDERPVALIFGSYT
ncbi:MAG: EF-hand domain-containing protein [Planctomycetota bacterium]